MFGKRSVIELLRVLKHILKSFLNVLLSLTKAYVFLYILYLYVYVCNWLTDVVHYVFIRICSPLHTFIYTRLVFL